MPKLVRPPQRPTHPLIWCAAILCAILAVAVVVTGIIVFVGYIVIHPKVPKLRVTSANIDQIYYDQASQLTVRLIIVLQAENDNQKAHASFYETRFDLLFQGKKIAVLKAQPFDVRKNSSWPLAYVVESNPIPLNPQQSDVVDSSFAEKHIRFVLQGYTRTRWRVGLLGSVKFWLRLSCPLDLPIDKSSIDPKCVTRSK